MAERENIELKRALELAAKLAAGRSLAGEELLIAVRILDAIGHVEPTALTPELAEVAAAAKRIASTALDATSVATKKRKTRAGSRRLNRSGGSGAPGGDEPDSV